MDQKYIPYIIAAAVILLLVIIFIVRKNKKKNQSNCPIDLDILIKALGGKNNITKVESSPSTLKVKLNDDKNIDIDSIKSLGASGIVQGTKQLTMIFGKASRDIEFELTKRLF